MNITTFDEKLMFPKSNIPVFSDERSMNLLVNVIRMLSPPGGSVLDPFSGQLTAAIACLLTARPCITMDSSEGMRFSVARLRIPVFPDTNMENFNNFIDPVLNAEVEGTAEDPCRMEREIEQGGANLAGTGSENTEITIDADSNSAQLRGDDKREASDEINPVEEHLTGNAEGLGRGGYCKESNKEHFAAEVLVSMRQLSE